MKLESSKKKTRGILNVGWFQKANPSGHVDFLLGWELATYHACEMTSEISRENILYEACACHDFESVFVTLAFGVLIWWNQVTLQGLFLFFIYLCAYQPNKSLAIGYYTLPNTFFFWVKKHIRFQISSNFFFAI